MFREMRRGKQALSVDETIEILHKGTSGVLALSGDCGYPYAVPLSYVFIDDKLYFHCATEGHKLDAIKSDPRASFCVTAQDIVSPEEYTTHYKSVIVFGKISIMEDDVQKLRAIRKLSAKYAPNDSEHHRDDVIGKEWKSLCMLEMVPEHITGRQAKELMQRK